MGPKLLAQFWGSKSRHFGAIWDQNPTDFGRIWCHPPDLSHQLRALPAGGLDGGKELPRFRLSAKPWLARLRAREWFLGRLLLGRFAARLRLAAASSQRPPIGRAPSGLSNGSATLGLQPRSRPSASGLALNGFSFWEPARAPSARAPGLAALRAARASADGRQITPRGRLPRSGSLAPLGRVRPFGADLLAPFGRSDPRWRPLVVARSHRSRAVRFR